MGRGGMVKKAAGGFTPTICNKPILFTNLNIFQ